MASLGCKSFLVQSLALVAIGLLVAAGWSSYSAYQKLHRQPAKTYGLVIDAGSHGNRIHLYQWPERIHDPNRPLKGPVTYPEHIWQYSTAPGISSKVDAPEETGRDCIAPLIEQATTELRRRYIPEDMWGSFPLYLKATAGMRDVGVTTRGLVMWNIRDFLTDTKNNPFKFRPEWARVTAGEEEGVYGWLTVNKALGTLDEPANETFGALDMGGASTQITFFPIHTSVMEDFYALTLGDHLLRLYAHSYLGFGWGDALMRLTTRLGVEHILTHLEANEGQPKLAEEPLPRTNPPSAAQTVVIDAIHPCFPTGHEFIVRMPSLAYPDGRFFIDLNYENVVRYMEAVGLPKHALSEAKNAMFSQDSEQVSIIHRNVAAEERSLSGFPSFIADDLMEEEAKNEIMLPSGEDDDLNDDDVSGDVPPRPQNNSNIDMAVSGDVPPRPQNVDGNEEESETDAFINAKEGKKKKHKHEERFAGIEFQDHLGSLYYGGKHGSFQALGNERLLFQQQYAYVIRFTGGSDFAQCQQRAKDLFWDGPCFIHSCSFSGVYQPRIADSKFIAFGQYSKVQTALGLPPNTTLDVFGAAAGQVCALNRKTMRKMHKKGIFRPYGKNGMMNLCWKATWCHTMLTHGLGFDSNSTSIRFAQTVGEGPNAQAPGWGLGSMIYEVNFFPWDSPKGRYFTPLLYALATCGSLALLSAVLASHIKKLQNMHTTGMMGNEYSALV